MTIEEIKRHPKEYLTPEQAAGVAGMDPQYIRELARTDPAALGFKTYRSGKNGRVTKIPRRPFLRFFGVDPDE